MGLLLYWSRSLRVRKTLSSERTRTVVLNTDWLTDEQVEYHQDLLDATVIYFDFGTDDYIPVILNTASIVLNKKYNEKMYSWTLEFEYSYKNSRQVD